MKFSKSERVFVGNFLTLMRGRTFAVGISFLLTPVVARLFDPEHWGTAAVFLALTTIFGMSATLCYDRAIPGARQESDAVRLTQLSFLISFGSTLVLTFVGAILSLSGSLPNSIATISAWLWLLPFSILVEALLTTLESWLLRHSQYSPLSNGESIQVLARTGIRLGVGTILGSSVGGLVISNFIAYFAKAVVLLRACKNEIALRSEAVSRRSLVSTASEYKDFPQFNFPTNLLMQSTHQLPLFVLATYFGVAAAGFFGMADRIVRAPINMMGNTFYKVFLKKTADISSSGRTLRPAMVKGTAVLAAIAAPPCILLWIYGQELISVLLGQRWSVAGKYAEILAPVLFVQWVVPPFRAAATVLRLQKQWLWLEVLAAVARAAVIPAAVFFKPTPEVIVSIYVWATTISKAFSMMVIWRLVPRKAISDAAPS